MQILVTGGAGFIGSHTIDHLLERGDSVVCIDNFNESYDPKIKEYNLSHHKANRNLRVYRLDIRNLEALDLIFENEKIDKIIHLAATTGIEKSIKDPLGCFSANITGTINLLEMAKKHKVRNFVFASSSVVYGNTNESSLKESDNLVPLSPYAATKMACESIAYTYNHLYNLPVTCLRLFTVYGPRARPDTVTSKFITKLKNSEILEFYGDGKTNKDFVYISDVIDGIVATLDANLEFEIINLGNSTTTTISHLLNLISKELEKEPKLERLPSREGESNFTQANITKAKQLLNYDPKVGIEEGIKLFVDWFVDSKMDI